MSIERTFGDEPFGGHCGEMMELEGREPTINTLLHLWRHPNRVYERAVQVLGV
jgi:hypothetical protein